MILARAFAIAAALAGGSAAAEPYQHKASGFECADELAGFRRVAVVDYEAQHPGLGAACKYRLGDALVADVFIYTAGLAPVPRESTHPALLQLHAQTVEEIREFAASRGEQAERTENALVQIATRRGPVTVLHDAFVIRAPGGTRETWLWLWSARGHVMKIRMTRLPGAEPLPAPVRAFSDAVVRAAVD